MEYNLIRSLFYFAVYEFSFSGFQTPKTFTEIKCQIQTFIKSKTANPVRAVQQTEWQN